MLSLNLYLYVEPMDHELTIDDISLNQRGIGLDKIPKKNKFPRLRKCSHLYIKNETNQIFPKHTGVCPIALKMAVGCNMVNSFDYISTNTDYEGKLALVEFSDIEQQIYDLISKDSNLKMDKIKKTIKSEIKNKLLGTFSIINEILLEFKFDSLFSFIERPYNTEVYIIYMISNPSAARVLNSVIGTDTKTMLKDYCTDIRCDVPKRYNITDVQFLTINEFAENYKNITV